jgi:endonuclease/exonuclease/phosphatase family metal-dependent hydrolase
MVSWTPPFTEADKLEFDLNVSDAPGENSFVIASYNIRYARGRYLIWGGVRRKLGLMSLTQRPRLIAANIAEAAEALSNGKLLPRADIIALQEADKRTVRSGGQHVARELAAALGMNWVHAPAGIPRGIKPVTRQWWLDFEEPIGLHDEGDTGVAILSRYPLSNLERIDLPWQECPWRPRLAVAADVSLGLKTVRIVNAHVDPHAAVGGQLAQLGTLAGVANAATGPTIVLGDFNTLSNRKCAETRSYLESQGYVTLMPTGTATWRGAGLRMHADWIFTRGIEIESWGVARPLNVSDHWPIWAKCNLSPESQ